MNKNSFRYFCFLVFNMLTGTALLAGQIDHVERAKKAAARIASAAVPRLHLVLVQDSATEPALAGAIAELEVPFNGARLEKSFEEGKTKWALSAGAQIKTGALQLNGRFEGWIDVGSARWISRHAAVGGGIGYAGDIKAQLKIGEPLLLTSSEVHNAPGESPYSETLSLLLVWK
jgi:hypothetical protein